MADHIAFLKRNDSSVMAYEQGYAEFWSFSPTIDDARYYIAYLDEQRAFVDELLTQLTKKE